MTSNFRYLIEGVEKTVNLVKNSQQFLDDPEFEKKLLEMRNSIGSDLYKVNNNPYIALNSMFYALHFRSQAQ
jgi:hypothetical protein